MVKICPKCGTHSIDDQSMFCNKCGTKLPENIPHRESNFCPKCGTKILREESAFCNACGSPLPISQPVNPPPIAKQPVPEQNERRQPAINGEVCPVCGAIVEAGRYYCNSCGAYMKGSPAPHELPGKSQVSLERTNPQNSNQVTRSQRRYSMNVILILLLGVGLVSLCGSPTTLALTVIIVIISAIAVYYDAKAIGAGGQSQNGSMNNEESTFSTYTWSPLSWGLIVLLLWIIGLPLYLIKRRELFTLNINGSIPAGVTRSVYPGTPYKASLGNSYESGRSLTTEFVLGLLGGIIGFFAGFAAIGIGGIGSVFGAANAGTVIVGGAGAIVFSILGIIGAAIVNRHTKAAGYLMIISAICGLICISLFYVLSFILLIIAGIMAVRHNE
ncbi:double zinc ribbon domain-containing protein [Methanoregula sp.]|uniref:double zinc ribbon domain-containing protein n=2 Tax=Methanoregula sp. TaxID=2052170 RepID=UPI003BAF5624